MSINLEMTAKHALLATLAGGYLWKILNQIDIVTSNPWKMQIEDIKMSNFPYYLLPIVTAVLPGKNGGWLKKVPSLQNHTTVM